MAASDGGLGPRLAFWEVLAATLALAVVLGAASIGGPAAAFATELEPVAGAGDEGDDEPARSWSLRRRGPAGPRFGQWWWEAELGGGGRSFESRQGAERLSRQDQQELRFGLGVNGYIVHPAVSRFRLGLDLALSEYGDGRSLDSERLGLRGDLNLFPRGAYPLSLYFARRRYDYAGSDASADRVVFGIPDGGTEWGGRLRVRRGVLGGTLLGFEHSAVDFVDPRSRREIDDRQFADWSRSGAALKSHLRLERRDHAFGTVDLDLEDLVANFDQVGNLAPTWRWTLVGSGIRRDVLLPGRAGRRVDSMRMRNLFSHGLRGSDLLDLQYQLALYRSQGSDSTTSHDLSVVYRWRARPGLELSPFAAYAQQAGERVSVEAPRAGLAATWARQGGALDWSLSGRTSYGRTEVSSPEGPRSETALAFGAAASVGQGREDGLRKELEIEFVRNDLRASREPIAELPDLGLRGSEIGREDLSRARASLRHRWDSRWLNAYAEWSRRATAGDMLGPRLEAETLTGNAQLGGARFNLLATIGATEFVEGDAGEQSIDFLSGAATWRPLRPLQMRLSYRTDRRRFLLVPDLAGDHLEAGFSLQVGRLQLEATFFETADHIGDGPRRANRGLIWTFSRRFAGWLPIATGPTRRGVIR